MIEQDFDGNLGGTVWDTALVLIKYFEYLPEFPQDYFKGKRIIELGGGTGVIGVTVAVLGADTIVTDRKSLLGLIQRNVEHNNVTERCKAIELNWGDDCTKFYPPFDLVLASDVVATPYKADYAKLLKTLDDLSDQHTTIYLAYEIRTSDEVEFFNMLDTKFIKTQVPASCLDKEFCSPDIGIFKIKKKAHNQLLAPVQLL